MGDPEVITLSSDDEDSAALPVIGRVVSLPAAESARQLSITLSRAPKKNGKKGLVKKKPEKARDPNLLFSVRTRGDTTDEEGAEDEKDKHEHVTEVPLRLGSNEVITIEDDEPVQISEPEPKVEPSQGKQSIMTVEKPSSSVVSNGSAHTSHSTGSETTEVIDADQKSELSMASVSTAASTTILVDYIQASKEEIVKFCQLLKSKVPPRDYKKLKGQLADKFNALKDQPKEFHEKLTTKFASGIRKILDGENEYTRTKKMKNYMKPGDSKFLQLKAMETYETSDDETAKADREAEKDKKVAKLENMLKKIHEKIQELDEEEVDFSDENNLHNSPFMMREKLIQRSMKVYYSLCEARKCLTQTGRPTQKKINIQNTTMYPEMEQAVQNFVNKQNHLFAPDFTDIYNIVSAENHKIHLGSEALHKIAEDLHKQVVLEIQERRKQDTLLAFPSSCDLGTRDPAEDDAELERKLEENKTKGRTIKSIVDQFVQAAEKQGLKAEEVQGDETGESSVESEDEDEPSSNADRCSDDGLPDIRLSEEYAAGPEAECLCDDEDDEQDVSQSLVFAPEDNSSTAATPASSTANVNETAENGNETEEPQTKKIRTV